MSVTTFESRRVRKAVRKIRATWTEEDYRRRSGATERLPRVWGGGLLVSLERVKLYDAQAAQELPIGTAVDFGEEAMEAVNEGESVRGT